MFSQNQDNLSVAMSTIKTKSYLLSWKFSMILLEFGKNENKPQLSLLIISTFLFLKLVIITSQSAVAEPRVSPSGEIWVIIAIFDDFFIKSSIYLYIASNSDI
ncbi:TPA: hypothetical protein DEG21_04165 [Patescibacteria group bacterium]|nr:hypothetical protein [Candidatus Gracilibacteria bacterium]